MSRSYDYHPFCVQASNIPGRRAMKKRAANKVLRHTNDVPDGKVFRKYSEPWNIKDYASYIGDCSYDEAVASLKKDFEAGGHRLFEKDVIAALGKTRDNWNKKAGVVVRAEVLDKFMDNLRKS